MESKSNIKRGDIEEAVRCVKELTKDLPFKDKRMDFLEETQNKVLLQITFKKIPVVDYPLSLKFPVPHPMNEDNKDVCLITSDVNLKTFDNEKTVIHYKEILSRNNLDVGEIIPYRQLRAEYKTFESLRHLSDAYDVFLADGRISRMLPGVLGKHFIKKKKLPISINLTAKNLKKEFESALSTTTLYVTGKGNICTTIVGITQMTSEYLVENLQAVIDKLPELSPGGWMNISSLHLKLAKSIAYPIYISLVSSNEVGVPVLIVERGKPIIDELDTLTMSKIKIFPSGDVQLIKNDQIEDNIENEITEFEKLLLKPIKNKNSRRHNKKLFKKSNAQEAATLKANIHHKVNGAETKEVPKTKTFKTIKKKIKKSPAGFIVTKTK